MPTPLLGDVRVNMRVFLPSFRSTARGVVSCQNPLVCGSAISTSVRRFSRSSMLRSTVTVHTWAVRLLGLGRGGFVATAAWAAMKVAFFAASTLGSAAAISRLGIAGSVRFYA